MIDIALPQTDRPYGVSCFVTSPASKVNGPTYHYAHGKITRMYWGQPGKPLLNGKVYTDKNIEEFMQVTRAELGTEWEGTLFLRSGPPPGYGISLDKWQFGPAPFRRT